MIDLSAVPDENINATFERIQIKGNPAVFNQGQGLYFSVIFDQQQWTNFCRRFIPSVVSETDELMPFPITGKPPLEFPISVYILNAATPHDALFFGATVHCSEKSHKRITITTLRAFEREISDNSVSEMPAKDGFHLAYLQSIRIDALAKPFSFKVDGQLAVLGDNFFMVDLKLQNARHLAAVPGGN